MADSNTLNDNDALELLAARVLQAIRSGERFPIRLIDDDAATLIVRCYGNSMLAVHRFESELERVCREHKIGPRHFNFIGKLKKRGAAQAKAADEMARASERVQRASGQRNTAQQEQTRRRLEQAAPTAEQMMMADDAMMRIAGLLLHFRAKRLWVDDFHKTIRSDWKGGFDTVVVPAFNLDDATVLNIMTWANGQDSELAGNGKQRFVDAIEFTANLDHRNEVKDWLETLTWDGVQRIDTFLVDIYRAEATEFNCAVGTNMLVASVARIYEPGCQFDNLAVLIGGQGLFKSQSLRVLGGQWYRSLQAGIDSADFVRGMHGAWVIELPELSSMTKSPHNAETTKARLSTQVNSLRPLYKNFYRDMPRNSVPWGTTNDEHFHHDPTSEDARRYWPVFVCIDGEMIDLDRLKAEREQLLAEAVTRYRAGHKYWEVPGAEQRALIERVRRVNEFQDSIGLWLANQLAVGRLFDGETRTFGPELAPQEIANTCWNGGPTEDDWGTAVSIDRVAKWALGLNTAQLTQNRNAHAIGEALRHLGFSKQRCRILGQRQEDAKLVLWRRVWVADDGRVSQLAPRLEPEAPPF